MYQRLTTIAASLAIMATPLLAAAPANAAALGSPSDPAGSRSAEVSCTGSIGAVRAVGTAEVEIGRLAGYHTVTVKRYKIDYSGGEHGNSANINLGLEGPGSSLAWWKSRDELYQDGQWHSNLTLSGPLKGSIPGPLGQNLYSTVRFTFDRSGGPDFGCDVKITTVY